MKSCRHGVQFDSPAHNEYTYVHSFADAPLPFACPLPIGQNTLCRFRQREVFDA